jgi:hypothetical protein
MMRYKCYEISMVLTEKFRFFRIDLGSFWLFECESVKIEFCYFLCSICFAFSIGIGSNSKLLKVVIFRYFIIWSQFYSILFHALCSFFCWFEFGNNNNITVAEWEYMFQFDYVYCCVNNSAEVNSFFVCNPLTLP